jgi:hypothetical protein
MYVSFIFKIVNETFSIVVWILTSPVMTTLSSDLNIYYCTTHIKKKKILPIENMEYPSLLRNAPAQADRIRRRSRNSRPCTPLSRPGGELRPGVILCGDPGDFDVWPKSWTGRQFLREQADGDDVRWDAGEGEDPNSWTRLMILSAMLVSARAAAAAAATR